MQSIAEGERGVPFPTRSQLDNSPSTSLPSSLSLGGVPYASIGKDRSSEPFMDVVLSLRWVM